LDRAAEILLAEGFTSLTVDELARRLKCSKSTLYGVAATKELLVIAVTKRFFEQATRHIESEVESITDPGRRISSYLKGVGAAMSDLSTSFYQDMVSYPPTAEIYDINSAAAARRVRELIENGVEQGHFRDVDAHFAGHVIAWNIEGIQSGRLLAASGLSAGQAYLNLGDLLLMGLGKASPQVADR
jgi:AcrR family transcriptional regulator